jgi:hypothetical protein
MFTVNFFQLPLFEKFQKHKRQSLTYDFSAIPLFESDMYSAETWNLNFGLFLGCSLMMLDSGHGSLLTVLRGK